MHNPPFKLSRNLKVIVALLCTSLELQASDAGVYSFDLPAQPLANTLEQLARQSQTKLLYSDKSVQGIKADPVKGRYTLVQALKLALDDSGLGYEVVDKTLITVKNTAKETPPATRQVQDDTVLKAITVTAEAENENSSTNQNGSHDPYNKSYKVTSTSTATKTDTPVIETPVSVQVVTQQVIKDQQITKIEEALTNVSGVFQSDNLQWGGTNDEFNIRGFNTNNIYQNGFRLPERSISGKLDPANIQQIEVIKGPSAMLYGRIDPGGLINTVTKQPLSQPYYNFQQQFGSYDHYRTTIDATGPIKNNESLLYRVNLAYENSDSFRDFLGRERVFVAPIIRWDISKQTQATLDIQYLHNEQTVDSGIPAVGNRPGQFSRNVFFGQPFDQAVSDTISVGINWSHAFNDNWTISHQLNYRNADVFMRQSLLLGAYDPPLQPGQTTTPQRNYGFKNNNDTYSTSLNLTGKFSTFGMDHTLLFGGDYYRHDFKTDSSRVTRDYDIANPLYLSDAPSFIPDRTLSYNDGWYGLYFQDQIKLPYGINVMGGVRYDYADGKAALPIFDLKQSTVQEKISPRVGVSWEFLPDTAFYGHYSEGFGNNNIQSFNAKSDGSPFDPETAKEWELGFKTLLFDNRLSSTVSYFNLTKNNITTPDLQNPGFSVLTGEVINQGVEVDISGEILPNWNIITSYAYIDSDITKTNNSNAVGNQWPNTPTHSGSLWSTYAFDAGIFRGFKLGGGMVARGQRPGDQANQYQIPGYVVLNMLASYEWKVGKSKITAQLNANNLLDKTYFTHSNLNSDQVFFGTPRSFMGSIRLEF